MTKPRVDWRAELVKENLWDYPLKSVPVPPVREMVEEIEQLRREVDELRTTDEPTEIPLREDPTWQELD